MNFRDVDDTTNRVAAKFLHSQRFNGYAILAQQGAGNRPGADPWRLNAVKLSLLF